MKGMNNDLVGLLVSGVFFVGAPLVGLAVTVFFMRGAFRQTASEGVDPSQKARVLAEGISEAMNATACGLVVSCLALVPIVVFAVRLYRDSRDSKRSPSAPTGPPG